MTKLTALGRTKTTLEGRQPLRADVRLGYGKVGLAGREPRRAPLRPGLRRLGQVVVELMLILPVFLLMIFFIMELGYVAFQTLVTNHAAYECARIAAMVGGEIRNPARAPKFDEGRARTAVRSQLHKMIGNRAQVRIAKKETLKDPQTGMKHFDVIVEVENPVRLLFPGSSYILSTHKGQGIRILKAAVRMPVENPAPYTSSGI